MTSKTKGKCEKCGRRINVSGLLNYETRRICKWCFQKVSHRIGGPKISKKEAIERKYKVKRGASNAYLSPGIPLSLVGKTLKLKIVNEEEDEK